MESTGGQRVSLVANQKQHTFAVKKNDGDGNCLFHALEQTRLFEELKLGHADIRSRIVDYVMEHWDDVGVSMVEQHRENIRSFRSSRVSLEQKRVAYWKYMSQWGAYATYGELEIASVIWNFGFSVLMYKDLGFLRRIISNEKGQYDVMNSEVPDMSTNGSGDDRPWFYFRFTGNPNSGHWENMCPIFLPQGVQMLPKGRFDFDHYDEQSNTKVYIPKEVQVKLPKTEPEVKPSFTQNDYPVFAKCPPQPGSGKAKDKKRPRSESPKPAKKGKRKVKRIKLTMPWRSTARNGRKRKRSCSSANQAKRPRSKDENDRQDPKSPEKMVKTGSCDNCTRNDRPKDKAKRSRSLSSEKSKDEAADTGRCGRPKKTVERSRSYSPGKSKKEVCSECRHERPKEKVKSARSRSSETSDPEDCNAKARQPPGSFFCGKRVLIAGVGCSGLQLIQRFYEAGAHVFVIDNEDDVLKEIRECFEGVSTFQVETFRWSESQKILASLAPLDHLVNNAGILHPKRVLDLCPEDVKCSFKVNFNWLLGISIAFCKGRINENCTSSGGSIVNISSVFDRLALPGGAMYCCSQAALSALTRSLAVEFGCHNIRVNTVKTFPLAGELPDPDSEYSDNKTCKDVEKYLKDMEARKLIKESLNYEQIADSVLFLLGPESSGITGTEISVHAGITEF